MATATKSKRRSPRTERVNVFCTPEEKRALKRRAADEDKPMNQMILDTLGLAEVDTTGSSAPEATPEGQGA